jgi:hypothetical protein
MPKGEKKTSIFSVKVTVTQLEQLLEFDPMLKFDHSIKPSPTRAFTCILSQAKLLSGKTDASMKDLIKKPLPQVDKKVPKVKKTK